MTNGNDWRQEFVGIEDFERFDVHGHKNWERPENRTLEETLLGLVETVMDEKSGELENVAMVVR